MVGSDMIECGGSTVGILHAIVVFEGFSFSKIGEGSSDRESTSLLSSATSHVTGVVSLASLVADEVVIVDRISDSSATVARLKGSGIRMKISVRHTDGSSFLLIVLALTRLEGYRIRMKIAVRIISTT